MLCYVMLCLTEENSTVFNLYLVHIRILLQRFPPFRCT